jgi:transposase-like protein
MCKLSYPFRSPRLPSGCTGRVESMLFRFCLKSIFNASLNRRKASTPSSKTLIQDLKKILGAYDHEYAMKALKDLAEELGGQVENVLELLEEGLEDTLVVLELPERYRRRMKRKT